MNDYSYLKLVNTMWIKTKLTIQDDACVGSPEFVDGNTSVIAVVCVGHVEECQL